MPSRRQQMEKMNAERESSWRPTMAVPRSGQSANKHDMEAGFERVRQEARDRDARRGQTCNTCGVGECGHFERDKDACEKWQAGSRLVDLERMDAAIDAALEAE